MASSSWAIAGGGLLLAYLREWGAEKFLIVPNSLVIIVYIVGMAAGIRLLSGRARLLAATATLLSLALLPFAGISLRLRAAVAIAALGYRRARQAFASQAKNGRPQPPEVIADAAEPDRRVAATDTVSRSCPGRPRRRR